ncbi:MAG TPA: hypothetical protein VMF11_10370 [Candidatus Baltobacteraceae bacterium]|nr:hypothetical protein [Candidatus Baltobacteraceae bacterium]
MSKNIWGEKYPRGQSPIEVAARHSPWWFWISGTLGSAVVVPMLLSRSGLPAFAYVCAGIGIMAFAYSLAGLVAKIVQRRG